MGRWATMGLAGLLSILWVTACGQKEPQSGESRVEKPEVESAVPKSRALPSGIPSTRPRMSRLKAKPAAETPTLKRVADPLAQAQETLGLRLSGNFAKDKLAVQAKLSELSARSTQLYGEYETLQSATIKNPSRQAQLKKEAEDNDIQLAACHVLLEKLMADKK